MVASGAWPIGGASEAVRHDDRVQPHPVPGVLVRVLALLGRGPGSPGDRPAGGNRHCARHRGRIAASAPAPRRGQETGMKGGARVGVAALMLGAVLASVTPGLPQAQQPIDVACSPSAPVAGLSETIRVRAWAISTGEPLSFRWAATTGRIPATGAEVDWKLDASDARPPHRATVRVDGAAGRRRKLRNLRRRALACRWGPRGGWQSAPATGQQVAG